MNPIATVAAVQATADAPTSAATSAAPIAAQNAAQNVDTLLSTLPTSTLIYIVLLIATYALHAIFMHYTIGGALWTLGSAIREIGRAHV